MHLIPDPVTGPFESNATPGLRHEPPPAQPLNLGSALRAVLQMAGEDHFLTTQEREELKRLDAEWEGFNAKLTETTHQSIRAEFRRLLAKGTPEPESAMEERGALLRRSLKNRMRQTTTKAIPVAVEASNRLAAIAAGVVRDLEEVEKDEAARLGVPFLGSPILRAAKYFAAVAKDFQPFPTAGCRPSNLLPYVVE